MGGSQNRDTPKPFIYRWVMIPPFMVHDNPIYNHLVVS